MRDRDSWKGRPCVDVTTAAYASTIDFVHEAEQDRLAIPSFQRGYVWGPTEALALIDSMMRGYPIGNLMIWYPGAGPRVYWPTGRGIVLDGQQRITTLRGALLHGSPGGIVPRIAFDLVADDFVTLDADPTPLQFPIAEAIRDRVGLDACRQIEAALGVPDDRAEREARRMEIWRSIAGDLPPPTNGKRPKQIKPAAWARAQAEWTAASEEFQAKEAPLMAPVYRYANRLGEVIDRLRYHRIAITAIRGGDLQDVREIFRRINAAGRPIDEAGIEALLNGAANA